MINMDNTYLAIAAYLYLISLAGNSYFSCKRVRIVQFLAILKKNK